MEKQTTFKTKQPICKVRTAGDGMESDENCTETKRTGDRKSIDRKSSLLPGRLVQIFPTAIKRNDKKKSINAKTPKFVPYEPYTAAVKPMTRHATSKEVKKSKNHMDINTLILQMSQMKTELNEFKPRPKLNSSNSMVDVEKVIPENAELQKQINELNKENETLKEQLKQQVQVNKELKTMLVASMGEDLEVQVQSLNEDKKHLAKALINSAQHLSTHQEQTEWLAGQCEVWRSKFLASSLMVEELAECKNLLNNKTIDLQQAIKQLLDERCRVRDMLLCSYKNLFSLHENWLENIALSEYVGSSKVYCRPIGNLNFSSTVPHSANIIDLASVNLKLSENVSSSVDKQDVSYLDSLPIATDGEKYAESIMAAPLEVSKANEGPVNALVNHAYNNSTSKVLPVASCAHCNGKVQLL